MTRAPDLAFALPRPLRGQVRIFEDVCTEHLGVLEDAITTECAGRNASVASLNQGGWKSGEIFARRDRCTRGVFASAEAVARAFDAIAETFTALVGFGTIAGWAMINRGDSQHPRHRHQGAALTGVYYVTVGDPDPGKVTPTTFETPGATWGDELQVDPRPGRLVVFPGDLWHSVGIVSGLVPRITIAFDVRR